MRSSPCVEISQAAGCVRFPQGPRVHALVFDEEDRVIILEHSSIEQGSRFMKGAGSNHMPPRSTYEVLLQGLAMGWTVTAPTAHGRANHQRHPHFVVVHPAIFSDVIDHLVGGEQQKISEHDLNDGAEPAH